MSIASIVFRFTFFFYYSDVFVSNSHRTYIYIYTYIIAHTMLEYERMTSNSPPVIQVCRYSNLNPPVVPAKCNCVSITTFRRIDFGIKYQIVGFICFFSQFLFHPTAFRSICRSETFERKINLTIFKNQINLSGEI